MVSPNLDFLARRNAEAKAAKMPDPQKIEDEIADEVRKYAPKQQRAGVGNSGDMEKVRQLITNAVTTAHEDAGRAMDNVLAEARNLMERIEDAVDAHKKELFDRGQKIAVSLDSAVQELTRTIQWVEKQSPMLRDPKLELPAAAPKIEQESNG